MLAFSNLLYDNCRMSEFKAVGFVGDGQLARMMVEDGLRMDIGLSFNALGTAGDDSPAAQMGARQFHGSLYDAESLRKLVEASDVTTIEIEHLDSWALAKLSRDHVIEPNPRSLGIIQDKRRQKGRLQKEMVPIAPFALLDDADDLEAVRARFDDRVIVKAATGGYDGRSNLVLGQDMTWSDIRDKFYSPHNGNIPKLYAEQLIDYKRELSVVGARDYAGKVALYPVVETIHVNNICVAVKAPAEIEPEVRAAAEFAGRQTIRCFKGAGVIAVEMFQDQDDQILVNEVAPRVHNSGHWTDLGSHTSQFEQHLRAILGMELGDTSMKHPAAVMINILRTSDGEFYDYMRTTQRATNGHVRWYGKAPRPGQDRKIGHITAVGDSLEEAHVRARGLEILNSP